MANVFKLISTGDPHLAMGVQTPIGRHPETFSDEQHAKLRFIGSYAKENGIGALVMPGDILNYKNPSLYTAKSINQIMGALCELKECVPVYSISGNHDLKMSSRQMKPESVYSIFTKGNVLQDVSASTVVLASFGEGKPKVTLSGVDYNSDHDEFWQELTDLNARLDPKDMNVVVLHEHLVPPGDELPFCHFLTYDKFLEFRNFNVIIAGHLHKGYKTMTLGEAVDIDADEEDEAPRHKITFVNPWSLTRLARDNYAVNDLHKPEIVEVTFNVDDKSIDFQHIEIPHRKFEEAFIKESLCSAESRNLDISEFVSSLNLFDTKDTGAEATALAPESIKDRIYHYMELANAKQ